MATKNGMVTLQVPEGDVKAVFAALDARAQQFAAAASTAQKEKGIEIGHTRQILTDQAMAQGWKSF